MFRHTVNLEDLGVISINALFGIDPDYKDFSAVVFENIYKFLTNIMQSKLNLRKEERLDLDLVLKEISLKSDQITDPKKNKVIKSILDDYNKSMNEKRKDKRPLMFNQFDNDKKN